MTGDELRAILDGLGMSTTAFQERVASVVVGEVTTAQDEKRRQNAVRNIKRWFSQPASGASVVVRPQPHYRAAVCEVLGFDPWSDSPIQRRLRELEAEVARRPTTEDLERRLGELLESIAAQASQASPPRSEGGAN